MKVTRPQHGKILQHGSGLGVPTNELVRDRARELALIAGRDPSAYTETDWEEAKAELHGGHEGANPDETPEIFANGDGPAASMGHVVARHMAEDEIENLGEELIAEGMDEAVHEQMLESRKNRH